jgi:hypothetical protein
VLRLRGGAAAHGAIWLTYYPNIMVEWYPHVLVVSTLHPEGPAQDAEHGRVLLPRGDRRLRARVRRGQQAAYMETCIEDDEIALRMDAGGWRCWSAATTRSAPTRARWKTACSTSTSGTGAKWRRARAAGMTEPARATGAAPAAALARLPSRAHPK